jgi:hypothetical protein
LDFNNWAFSYGSPVLEINPTRIGIFGWFKATELILANIYPFLSESDALSNQKQRLGISPKCCIHYSGPKIIANICPAATQSII